MFKKEHKIIRAAFLRELKKSKMSVLEFNIRLSKSIYQITYWLKPCSKDKKCTHSVYAAEIAMPNKFYKIKVSDQHKANYITRFKKSLTDKKISKKEIKEVITCLTNTK